MRTDRDNEPRIASWWRKATPVRRLVAISPMLFVAIGGVTAFHARDALRHHESLWPVVLATALSVVIIASVLWNALRPLPGVPPEQAVRVRLARMMRWVVPLGVAFTVAAAVGALLARK